MVISLLTNLNVSVEKCVHNVFFTYAPFEHEAPGGSVVPVMALVFLVLPLFFLSAFPCRLGAADLSGIPVRITWTGPEPDCYVPIL